MMAAMNRTERQKKTRMLERSHSRVLPEIEMALLYSMCGVCIMWCGYELRYGWVCIKVWVGMN